MEEGNHICLSVSFNNENDTYSKSEIDQLRDELYKMYNHFEYYESYL